MSIEVIQKLGDDALANLFEMSIGTIEYIGDMDTTLLRVQNFNIPSTGAGTYEVHYKTQKMTKVSGKIESPNEFTFDFRVDRNWRLYRGFVAWKNAVANTATGIIMSDGTANPLRVPVTVWPTDGDGEKITEFGQWKFRGAFVQSIGDIGLDYTSGDPIILTITMGFMLLDDTALDDTAI